MYFYAINLFTFFALLSTKRTFTEITVQRESHLKIIYYDFFRCRCTEIEHEKKPNNSFRQE